MGADMVGFILKGPVELDRRRLPTAIQRLCRELKKQRDSGVGVCYRCDIESPVEDHVCQECGEPLPATELTDDKAVADKVKDMFEAWPPDGRDCASRIDPDDPTQLLVFAGRETWGDEPDGCGYQYMKELLSLGIAETFGIR